MENYSAIKSNDFINFALKLMDLLSFLYMLFITNKKDMNVYNKSILKTVRRAEVAHLMSFIPLTNYRYS